MLNDYYHKRLPFKEELPTAFKQSFICKSNFPGQFKASYPAVDYGGVQIDFPITVWNWLCGKLQNGDSDVEELSLNYISKHNYGLFEHRFNERNFKNKATWFSALPEIMCLIVLSELQKEQLVKDRWQMLKSSSLYIEGIFIEYPSIQGIYNQPLNCQLFGFAWAKQNVNIIGEESFREIQKATVQLMSTNMKLLWSTYNTGRIASPFYNLLHLDQLKCCGLIEIETLEKKLIAHYALSPLIIILKIVSRVYSLLKSLSRS